MRVDGWRAALDTEIDAVRRAPFVWGENDCMTLAGRVARALTGSNPFEDWTRRYTTKTGAMRVLRSSGFDSVADGVAEVLPEVHPSQAHVGDIGLIETDDALGFAFGVINGERVFVMREDGIGTVDRMVLTRCFRIG